MIKFITFLYGSLILLTTNEPKILFIKIIKRGGKYELTKDQYSKLVESSKYWFMVKFSNAGSTRDGIVKDIFTEDPEKI
jgi:hypothetical protein